MNGNYMYSYQGCKNSVFYSKYIIKRNIVEMMLGIFSSNRLGLHKLYVKKKNGVV